MTSGLLERPRAPHSRDRAIPLTAQQIAELDEAIEAARQFGQTEPRCLYTMMACLDMATFITGAPASQSADAVAEDFVDIQGDTVRLIRPSLAQLLEARRRAILKR